MARAGSAPVRHDMPFDDAHMDQSGTPPEIHVHEKRGPERSQDAAALPMNKCLPGTTSARVGAALPNNGHKSRDQRRRIPSQSPPLLAHQRARSRRASSGQKVLDERWQGGAERRGWHERRSLPLRISRAAALRESGCLPTNRPGKGGSLPGREGSAFLHA